MNETKKAEILAKLEDIIVSPEDANTIAQVVEELDKLGYLIPGNTNVDKVSHFMEIGRQGISDTPCIPNRDTMLLRTKLIGEELFELAQVLPLTEGQEFIKFIQDKIVWYECQDPISEKSDREIIHHAFDATVDLEYVVLGNYTAFGLQNVAQDGFNEVHRANMSKFITVEEFKIQYPDVELSKDLPVKFGLFNVIIDPTGEYIVFVDDTGKIRKPASWTPPDLTSLF